MNELTLPYVGLHGYKLIIMIRTRNAAVNFRHSPLTPLKQMTLYTKSTNALWIRNCSAQRPINSNTFNSYKFFGSACTANQWHQTRSAG